MRTGPNTPLRLATLSALVALVACSWLSAQEHPSAQVGPPASGGKAERSLSSPNEEQPGNSTQALQKATQNPTEAKAREAHDVVVGLVRFDETARTIIDGDTTGFRKLIADRATGTILGCHAVGEHAVGEQVVEIVQESAIALAGRLRVDDLSKIPLSFPTYSGILLRSRPCG